MAKSVTSPNGGAFTIVYDSARAAEKGGQRPAQKNVVRSSARHEEGRFSPEKTPLGMNDTENRLGERRPAERRHVMGCNRGDRRILAWDRHSWWEGLGARKKGQT